jgi:hypothetical protein
MHARRKENLLEKIEDVDKKCKEYWDFVTGTCFGG